MVNNKRLIYTGRTSFHKKILVALLVILCSKSFSQKVTATVDKDKILLGEHIELLLKVDPESNNPLQIQQWFNLPDTFNRLEIVQRMPIDTVTVDNQTLYQQKIILTSYDTGHRQIPPFPIIVNSKPFNTGQLIIAVLPVDVRNLKDYHEIKDILPAKPPTIDWIAILVFFLTKVLPILIVIGAGIYFYIRYLRKKKNTPVKNKLVNVNDVLKEVDVLKQTYLIDKNEYKTFFTKLIALDRNYSDAQLQITTSTQTTGEYMLNIKGKIGEEPVQTRYFQLLRLADAVKFAKYIPSQEECETAVTCSKEFINSVYQNTFKPKANVS